MVSYCNLLGFLYHLLEEISEHVRRKSVFAISDQVRHNLGCTAPDASSLLDISDIETMKGQLIWAFVYCTSANEPRREKTGFLHMPKNKDADQLHGYPEADQGLCFRYTDSTIPLLPTSEISSL